MANQIRHVTLNNGVKMPVLGFGVYQIPAEQTEQAVSDALASGYRLLDTAEAYGNEEAVGRAISQSDVPRDELFVTPSAGSTRVRTPRSALSPRRSSGSVELDTGGTLFFDHADPAMVSLLNNRRGD
jgi:diketogulonate reductase-like aldo/keto reductase